MPALVSAALHPSLGPLLTPDVRFFEGVRGDFIVGPGGGASGVLAMVDRAVANGAQSARAVHEAFAATAARRFFVQQHQA